MDAGFEALHSAPIRWQGSVVGALNAFFARPGRLTVEQGDLLQAFADLAVLALLAPGRLSTEEMASRIDEAVAGRTVIEQAKGVLAYRDGLDMSAAYDQLLAVARQTSSPLTVVAQQILRDARRPRAGS